MCGLVYDSCFDNIASGKNPDFGAKESIPKAAQKTSKSVSQASKTMNTGAEGARKKWILDAPKNENFQNFNF